eukprot:TRINITY_DN51_c2_g1_i2.p1 TRINITY_DN51_c2_g1~~TRINITY_DN51_c2_g1_i2.p1  ORF type:complete len:431 (-),score=160.18 TRINITY_DN51_c2_g1_i2:131-1423(-)
MEPSLTQNNEQIIELNQETQVEIIQNETIQNEVIQVEIIQNETIQNQETQVEIIQNENETNPKIEIEINEMEDYRKTAIENASKRFADSKSNWHPITRQISRSLKSILQISQTIEIDPNEPKIECPICCIEVPMSQVISFANCKHQYCLECIKEYIEIAVSERRVNEFKCPNPSCNKNITYEEVKSIISTTMFDKYQDFSLQVLLQANPNSRWCPKPDCGVAVIGESDSKRITCPGCSYQYCFRCGDQWHPKVSCEKYKQWKIENGEIDEKFDDWAGKNTKKCPNCNAPIQKNAGCNHMNCRNCNFEFCWVCLSKYDYNHYSEGPCRGLQFSAIDAVPDDAFLPPEVRNRNEEDCFERYICLWITLFVILGILLLPLLLLALLIYIIYSCCCEAACDNCHSRYRAKKAEKRRKKQIKKIEIEEQEYDCQD